MGTLTSHYSWDAFNNIEDYAISPPDSQSLVQPSSSSFPSMQSPDQKYVVYPPTSNSRLSANPGPPLFLAPPRNAQLSRILPLPAGLELSENVYVMPESNLGLEEESDDGGLSNGDLGENISSSDGMSDNGMSYGGTSQGGTRDGESGNSRKEGRKVLLPFSETRTWKKMFDNEGLHVPAQISGRFREKYLRNEDYWIFYRRNYFAVACSYILQPPAQTSTKGKLWLKFPDGGGKVPVLALAMRLRAILNDDDKADVEITMFTKKRTKDGERTTLQPMMPNMPGFTCVYTDSTGDYGSLRTDVPTNFTFSRNQFRSATLNNGSRRKPQDYYRVVLELLAKITHRDREHGEPQWTRVASIASGRILTRGRPPNSFEKYDPNNPDHKRRKPRKSNGDGGASNQTCPRAKSTGTKGKAKGSSSRKVENGNPNKTGGDQQNRGNR